MLKQRKKAIISYKSYHPIFLFIDPDSDLDRQLKSLDFGLS